MKPSAINGQRKTALDWLAGRAVFETTGAIMQHKTPAWQAAHAAAKNIKKLKNPAVKRRQIVLWCQMVKLAMKAGA